MNLAATAEPYIVYYSKDYVRRKILRKTDTEILEQDQIIDAEIKAGIIPDPNAPVDPATGQPVDTTGPIDQPPNMPSSPKSPEASGDEIETPSGGEI